MEINGLLRYWLVVCALAGAVLAGSQLLEIPHRSALRGYDNTFNYLWLRSLAVDGDWDFRNDLEQCNTLTPDYRAAALALPATRVGRVPNKYGIGWALLTVPFYAVADGVVALGDGLGWSTLKRDGFNPVYQGWIQVGHVLLAMLALWLAAATIGRWIGDPIAATAGVVSIWAASPLLFYQTADIGMSHGAAFFAVALLAYALTRATGELGTRRWWLLAGAAFGLAVVTRFQLAVFAVPLAAAALRTADQEQRTGSRGQGAGSKTELPTSNVEVRNAQTTTAAGEGGRAASLGLRAFVVKRIGERAGLVLLGALPFLALQLWAWRVVYGQWVVFSYGAEGESFHWGHPELLRSLVSPWHGLLYWHPFVLAGIAGLAAWTWRNRPVALPWLIAVLLTGYINAAWWCWWFGSAFGGRSFDAALLPVMAGAAWILARGRAWVRAAWWTFALGAGLWNFYAVLLYRSGAISRSEPVTWVQMIAAAGRLGQALRF